MTYTEFKNKWIGKGIDYDGKYGFQCVDVYRMYVKEVLGVPQSPPVVGAKDIWDNYLKEYFTRIENTVEAVPKQGDVIIWSVGTYGHIAICDSANKDSFISFEQNWTHLDGTGVTELRTHQYKNVLGWLRPIISLNTDMTEDEKRALELLESYKIANKHGNLEGAVNALVGASNDLKNKTKEIEILQNNIKALEAQLEAVNSKVAELEAKFVENQKNLDICQSKLTTANSKIDKLNETISNITEEKNTWQTRYNNKNTEFNDVTEKFDNLSKLFEEYKKCYPETPKKKFNLINFIKSLFKK